MNIKTYEETLLLYELALSIGQSLDLEHSSKTFIDTLLRKKNLNYCALWVKKCIIDNSRSTSEIIDCEEPDYQLVYATPKTHIRETSITHSHPSVTKLGDDDCMVVQDTDADFKDCTSEKNIDHGVFTLFKLGELGLLKLYSRNTSTFQKRELNQLRDVISKFAIALHGSLAYKQLQEETRKLKKTEEALLTEQVKLKHQANYLISLNSDLEVEVMQRKRSQEELVNALHELKHQKQALDEHASVCITDIEGKITYANRKLCGTTGFRAEELIGQTYQLINPGLQDHQYFQSLWSTLAKGKTWQNIMKNQRKDGTAFWTDTTILPYMDKEGNIVKYVYLSSNVSEKPSDEYEEFTLNDRNGQI